MFSIKFLTIIFTLQLSKAVYIQLHNEETSMFLTINDQEHLIGSINSNNQKWELINHESSYFLMKNLATSKLLEASLDGRVYLMPFNNLTNQLWSITNKVIQNKASKQVLESRQFNIFTQFGYGSMSQNWDIHIIESTILTSIF
jgi:hypothetical protein